MPDTYPSSAACRGARTVPVRLFDNNAVSRGARANQQNALRHKGTGPAIAKGTACRMLEQIASSHWREEMERISLESNSCGLSGDNCAKESCLQNF